ncbi:MAG: ExbD/TolR family protein [Rubripirellula sp.]
MSIEFTCIECGTSHHVNDRLAGRRVRCPSCDTAVHVPEAETLLPSELEVEVAEVEEVIAVEAVAAPVEAVAVAAEEQVRSPKLDAAAVPPVEEDEDEDDQVLPKGNRPEEEMDMTPMVDVTFLLLIFFMVTAAFSLQKSIRMPRQQTDAPSTTTIEEETEELDQVEVQVDEFGSFLVMAPDWERETPGKQNLTTALKEAISGRSDGMKLIVKVHEMAKLHALVDAMDAGTIAGYSELEVTQVEEFD